MLPPYEKPILTDMRLRTTYRCIRIGCRMTVRLLEPIERCSRCDAPMTVVARPQIELDDFVAEATAEVVAGFEALLRAA